METEEKGSLALMRATVSSEDLRVTADQGLTASNLISGESQWEAPH